MPNLEQYSPGPPDASHIENSGKMWTLAFVRDLRHSPEKVWQALTEPAHLHEWAPFDADASLAFAGTIVKLTAVNAPTGYACESKIKRAEPPKLLEYEWGGGDVRWELEPHGTGTRLKLWASIDRHYISMGAAGWHICLDILDRLLSGNPVGRIAGGDALKFAGWQRLNAKYANQFGVETPKWAVKPAETGESAS